MNLQVSGDGGDLVLRPGDRSDDAELRRLNAEAFPANPKTRPEITAWQWWDNPFGDTIVHVWQEGDRLVGHVTRVAVDHMGVEFDPAQEAQVRDLFDAIGAGR